VEVGALSLTCFLGVCALAVNLLHDKSRYYEFKMVKYRRYFERLCAGDDLTTLGIDRLLQAVLRLKMERASANGGGSVSNGVAESENGHFDSREDSVRSSSRRRWSTRL
jgi:hypothetical protein